MVNLASFFWGGGKVNLVSFSSSADFTVCSKKLVFYLLAGVSQREGCCRKPWNGMEDSIFSKAPFPFRKHWCSRTPAEHANSCLRVGVRRSDLLWSYLLSPSPAPTWEARLLWRPGNFPFPPHREFFSLIILFPPSLRHKFSSDSDST